MILTTSADFAEAVSESHRHVGRVEIRTGTGTVLDDTFYMQQYFLLEECSYTYDRQAESRLTGSGTFAVINSDGLDFFNTTNNIEVVLFRGVFIDDNPEWVVMGVLRVSAITKTRDTDGALHVNWRGTDRSEAVRWLSWKQPYRIASGTNYVIAAKDLFVSKAGTFTPEFVLATTTLTTPEIIYTEEDDPWLAILKLAEAASCEAFLGDYGELVIQPITTALAQAPVASFAVGQSGQLLSPVSVEEDNREVYSGVIVSGEAPWLLFPVRGEKWDDDPMSRTYRGTMGEKPKRIGDPLAATDAQCALIAASEFEKVRGVVENISFGLQADPRYRVGDQFFWYDADLNLEGFMTLDTISGSLTEATMNGTIRRRS